MRRPPAPASCIPCSRTARRAPAPATPPAPALASLRRALRRPTRREENQLPEVQLQFIFQDFQRFCWNPHAPGQARHLFDMRLNKVEVNLRRLLEAAPRQQNQAKLVHYGTIARELLEQLGAETTPEGISSDSKAKLSEYSEKIEALAARLAAPVPENEKPVAESREEISNEKAKAESPISLSSELRRRSA
ncbi:hypothetical protein PVAP13_3KG228807 [Panicum virgatum]|uniref:Uncharacterized protein n=1 Tax=Panicum virgatum TaxID=38727 RepID=A0A8T0V125_PANVG|nr:hypothetical protein PVAP13_3KG228807 [Panicum virgatum]